MEEKVLDLSCIFIKIYIPFMLISLQERRKNIIYLYIFGTQTDKALLNNKAFKWKYYQYKQISLVFRSPESQKDKSTEDEITFLNRSLKSSTK